MRFLSLFLFVIPPSQFDRLMQEGSGRLMPDAPILRMLRAHLMKAHSEGAPRFVLDGFPRTVVQAQASQPYRRLCIRCLPCLVHAAAVDCRHVAACLCVCV